MYSTSHPDFGHLRGTVGAPSGHRPIQNPVLSEAGTTRGLLYRLSDSVHGDGHGRPLTPPPMMPGGGRSVMA
jgi:hypothetical protein